MPRSVSKTRSFCVVRNRSTFDRGQKLTREGSALYDRTEGPFLREGVMEGEGRRCTLSKEMIVQGRVDE
jgi:hypothetical protein